MSRDMDRDRGRHPRGRHRGRDIVVTNIDSLVYSEAVEKEDHQGERTVYTLAAWTAATPTITPTMTTAASAVATASVMEMAMAMIVLPVACLAACEGC
jgi:hypothetical protein